MGTAEPRRSKWGRGFPALNVLLSAKRAPAKTAEMLRAYTSMGLLEEAFSPRTSGWIDDASCLHITALMFEHECNSACRKKAGCKGGQVDEAKKLCRSCPVLEQCFLWSLVNTKLQHGVSGGMTEYERVRYRHDYKGVIIGWLDEVDPIPPKTED